MRLKKTRWYLALTSAVVSAFPLVNAVRLRAGTPTTSASVSTIAQTRQDFLRLIDRPHVAPQPAQEPMPAPAEDLLAWRLAISTEPGQRMPCLVLKSKTLAAGPSPTVIVLHGTGSRKEDNLDLLEMLARAQFIAIAPDARYHGERSAQGHGTNSYYAAIAQAYHDGKSHPWLYDEVFDDMRLVDYLQTRPDVDSKRIGLIGISKGGMETYLAAAVDPRIAVAVPCICLQSFRWELDHNAWHGRIKTVQGGFDAAAAEAGASINDPAFVQRFYDRLVPGIDGEFDCPAMLGLIAPRPMLAISGEKDPINPLPSALIAADAARAAYAAADASDRFDFILEKGAGHQVTPSSKKAAVAWFAKWLRQ